MSQLFQRTMKACRINASNLIEGIDDDARRSRSFKDAGFDWLGAEPRRETCQQGRFSCPWLGQDDCDARFRQQARFWNESITQQKLTRDMERRQYLIFHMIEHLTRMQPDELRCKLEWSPFCARMLCWI